MTFRICQVLFGFVFLLQSSVAGAALTIEVIGAGANQIPVAIVPLGGDARLSRAIHDVVAGDLQRSGMFRLVDTAGKSPHELAEVEHADWQVRGADALAIGKVGYDQKGSVEVR